MNNKYLIKILTALSFIYSSHASAFFSEETNICVKNETNNAHIISVTDIDNWHWDGNGRPDHNFNGVTIEAGSTICRREEVNSFSYSNHQKLPSFTFLIDGNPARMSMKPSVRTECSYCEVAAPGTGTNYSNPKWGVTVMRNAKNNILFGGDTLWFQSDDWFIGYPCESGMKVCGLFKIR